MWMQLRYCLQRLCAEAEVLRYTTGSLGKVYCAPSEVKANCGRGCWREHWTEYSSQICKNKICSGGYWDWRSNFSKVVLGPEQMDHSTEVTVIHCDMPSAFPGLRRDYTGLLNGEAVVIITSLNRTLQWFQLKVYGTWGVPFCQLTV